MLPAALYLAGAAVGSVPAPITAAAINASGTIVEVEPLNDPVTPQRTAAKSKANASPIPWTPCWITIPPSPPVFEPEANKIKRSATSKLVVFWKEAVPNTVKLRLTVKSWPITTSLGKPIVIVWPAADVSISLEVPAIVKVWVFNATVPLPVEPEKLRLETTPVKFEPSPWKAPLNEPERFEEAPVNWSEVVPVIVVPLSLRLELTNLPSAEFHLVTALLVNWAAPEIAIDWATLPL